MKKSNYLQLGATLIRKDLVKSIVCVDVHNTRGQREIEITYDNPSQRIVLTYDSVKAQEAGFERIEKVMASA